MFKLFACAGWDDAIFSEEDSQGEVGQDQTSIVLDKPLIRVQVPVHHVNLVV